MQIFIDSYSDSNFNATNVWFQEDLREKYSRYQSYGVILIYIFFSKEFVQSKEKKKYFKKNNPRRDASITFLIIENRACYTFTFHVSRMQLVKPNVRPCKKRAASFFHPGEKKPLPLPSLSPQKKRKEKNQTAEPTL